MTAPQNKYAVFFDLDRTLISEISGRAIVRIAWDNGLITWLDLFRAVILYMQYLLKLKDPLGIIGDMVSWTGGKAEREMKEICNIAFSELLMPSLHVQAREEIKTHKHNGAKVMLLSSALNYICEPMAVSLDLDGHLSSALMVRDGYFTGLPEGSLCFGKEKLDRLTGYCIAENIDPADAWFYSDSISDLPVLMSVGHPVCVNPDRRLRAEARRRAWKILSWND
jgi:HAD superfamily hydrolase (TIGR01490 family)